MGMVDPNSPIMDRAAATAAAATAAAAAARRAPEGLAARDQLVALLPPHATQELRVLDLLRPCATPIACRPVVSAT